MIKKGVGTLVMALFILSAFQVSASLGPNGEDPLGGAASPALDSLDLTNGETGGVCLTRHTDYVFNATISDPDGISDVKFVNITVEPEDENITFSWARDGTPKFSEVAGTDPSDLITLTSNNADWNAVSPTSAHVEFRLDFNWSYPDEDLSDIEVEVTDEDENSASDTYEGLFKVENDLDLSGSLTVTAQHQGVLEEEDWTRGSEKVVFSSQTVHYEGFDPIYPNDKWFNVSVDHEGKKWYDNSSSGRAYSVTAKTPAVSDKYVLYIISVNKLPVGRSGGRPNNQQFVVKVDADAPISEQNARMLLENNSVYTNDPYVYYDFRGIAEPAGAQSGLKGYYYAFSNNSGTKNGDPITATSGVAHFSPGWRRLYVWGEDNVGNIQRKVVSQRILVDTEQPLPGKVSLQDGRSYWNSTTVKVGLSEFSDNNDASSRGIAGYYLSTADNGGTKNGVPATGGIRGHYFNGNNFNTYVFSRYDSTINFPWGNGWGGPGHGVRRNKFSIIWNGSMFADEDATYNFTIGSDDGMRLYIDDILLLNYWKARAYTENTASVYLERGFHRFKMHYYEGGGKGKVTAKWNKWGGNPKIIPSSSFWGGQSSAHYSLSGEGEHTVYAWAQDYAHNIGQAVSDDIFIDLTEPSAASAVVEIENGSMLCSDKTIEVNWSRFEDPSLASGIKGYYISYFNRSGTDRGIWTKNTNYTMSSPEGDLTVFVWAEDRAGNRGLAVNSSIHVDYPDLLDITHRPDVFRGRRLNITFNLTDIVFGEEGLDVVLQIRDADDQEGWSDLPVAYTGDNASVGYWHSNFTPDRDTPLDTIFEVRVQFSNSGGFVSKWHKSAFMVVNNLPEINGTPIFEEEEENVISVDFNRYGWDPEDGREPHLVQWSVEEYDTDHITSVRAGEALNHYIFVPKENFFGNTTVLMRVTDKDGFYTEVHFTLRWIGVNDPPSIYENVVKAVRLKEDFTEHRIDLTSVFYDVDGDELSYAFENNEHLAVTSGKGGLMILKPEANWFGREAVTFTATDGKDKAVLTMHFEVEARNDPPGLVKELDYYEMSEDTTARLDVKQYFSDPDDEGLVFSAVSDSSHLALFVEENGSLFIGPGKDWSGETEVTVTGVDPAGSSAQFTFILKVASVNDRPEVFIDTIYDEESDRVERLEGRGSDVDGSITDYKWISSEDGWVGNTPTLRIEDNDYLSLGEHTIYFSVSDDAGEWSEEKSVTLRLGGSLIEILEINVRPTGTVSVGEEILVDVRVINRGDVPAKNVTVVVLVDEDRIDWVTFREILAEQERSVSIVWKAKAGEHNITVKIEGKELDEIVTGEGMELTTSVKVSGEALDLSFVYALAISIFAVIITLFLITYSRKRKRKKLIFELEERIRDAKKEGVSTGEVEEELEIIREEWRIAK